MNERNEVPPNVRNITKEGNNEGMMPTDLLDIKMNS